MTQEQLIQLSRIYNTLLSVKTCGEDMFTLTDCMRALLQLINEIDAQNKQGEIKEIKEG